MYCCWVFVRCSSSNWTFSVRVRLLLTRKLLNNEVMSLNKWANADGTRQLMKRRMKNESIESNNRHQKANKQTQLNLAKAFTTEPNPIFKRRWCIYIVLILFVCWLTLQTDMWNCLLLLSAKSKKVQYDHGGRIDLIGMDNAKLQCCTRALTNKCQQLCAKVRYIITG